MSKPSSKQTVPLDRVRRYLEPGPVVLVSSAWAGRRNVMTMGWHTVMAFSPALLGCIISSGSHSHELVRRSGECVINLPTTALTDAVIGCGNTSGAQVDKFARFGLTPRSAERVSAPLIDECHAHFECRLVDERLVDRYDMFILEVLAARAAREPSCPETLHYTGDGVFMVAGEIIDRREQFLPEML